ncbi:MAG: hypothetical protein WCD37_19070 [Chloroflexia bacterium]
MFDTLLDLRSSFVLAALVVTWIAVLILLLVIGNLHARLYRLEQGADSREDKPVPYAHLIGRQLQGVLGDSLSAPRVLVLLSSNCASCRHVLEELQLSPSKTPLALAWIDRSPSPSPTIPSHAIVLDTGPKISSELGIRVTPFAIVTNEDGRVLKASPINSLSTLSNLWTAA